MTRKKRLIDGMENNNYFGPDKKEYEIIAGKDICKADMELYGIDSQISAIYDKKSYYEKLKRELNGL